MADRHFGGGLCVLEVEESNLLAGSPGGTDVQFGVRSGRFGCSNNFAPGTYPENMKKIEYN